MGTDSSESPWRSRFRWGVLSLLLVGTAALLLGANSWKHNLSVASVVVRGISIVKASEIMTLARVVRGEPLFDVDLAAVKRRLEQHPYVSSASVQRDTPDRITIVITEREPIAIVLADRSWYLDSAGVVMPAVRSEHVFDLPVITGAIPAVECVPGKRISAPLVREALDVLNTARTIGDDTFRRISEIHVPAQGELTLYTAEYGIPVLLNGGDAGDGLLKLDGFWKGVVSQYGAQGLQYVDLRFRDQVVVRWSKPPGGTGM